MADRYHPIPTREKELRGNPGKRALNKNEPESDIVVELLDPPEYFGEYATREWKRTGPYLINNQLLRESDVAVFEAYCMNVQLMIESAIDIRNNGMTMMGGRGWVKNPAVSAFGQATTAIRGFAQEFGLSPSARSRIKVAPKDDDVLGALMGGESSPDNDYEGI